MLACRMEGAYQCSTWYTLYRLHRQAMPVSTSDKPNMAMPRGTWRAENQR